MILLLLLLLLVIVGESDSVFFENGGASKTLPRRERETGKRPLENPSLAKGKKNQPRCVPAAASACASCLHLATSAGEKSSCVDFLTAYSLPSSLCAALTTREKAPAPSGPSSRNSAA